MKVLRWLNLFIVTSFLAACSSGSNGMPVFGFLSTPTPLPSPQAIITHAPDAKAAVTAYLEAFKASDHAGMYAMLGKASRDSITQEDFAKRHNDAVNTMSASSLDFELISSLISPYAAEVAYRITYHTVLVGDIQRDIVMRLALEEDQWKVQWEDGLILPELAGGSVLQMDYQVPARGNIYDREGLPIVGQSDAIAFAIIPGQINDEMRGTLFAELARLCGYSADDIEARVNSSGADWYLPMCEATREEADRLSIMNLGGLVKNEYNSRYYFDQGLASQVIGYTQLISPEQLDQYRRLGYRGDEKIGQAGIEKWAEDYLAGKHGGSLYVVNPATGQILTRLGQSDPQPADSVYLTLDKNMQFYAEQVMQEFRGAVVVLERDTGRVLAMASSPGYDANLFDANNPNNPGLIDLLNQTDDPLLSRASQGQYPLGSVFKIITFSAALESGLYEKNTTYDCQYEFTELNDRVRYDWTYQHCQDEVRADPNYNCQNSSATRPSGSLTMQESLMRSCNPFFWHIGNDLYSNWDRGSDIANMARAFGLGSPTGIEQVAEATGQIENPAGPVEAVNQSIGQGDVLVTPLQVASFIAAVGNGGTLYRPQLVERIQPIQGDPVLSFKPEPRGTLPLRTENLQLLQEALVMVVKGNGDTSRPGTAQFRLRALNVPVAGKTGTAETETGTPHAWFAGYTMNSENSTLPDIAIAVIVEYIGEGSDYAAPIFQRMVDVYYTGSPQGFLWFESSYGVLNTPTPFGGIPTRTPRPEE